jgi:hypothetical protein
VLQLDARVEWGGGPGGRGGSQPTVWVAARCASCVHVLAATRASSSDWSCWELRWRGTARPGGAGGRNPGARVAHAALSPALPELAMALEDGSAWVASLAGCGAGGGGSWPEEVPGSGEGTEGEAEGRKQRRAEKGKGGGRGQPCGLPVQLGCACVLPPHPSCCREAAGGGGEGLPNIPTMLEGRVGCRLSIAYGEWMWRQMRERGRGGALWTGSA